MPSREVVLLAQQHREAAPGRVAGDAGAVDAAADDERGRTAPRHRAQPFFFLRLGAVVLVGGFALGRGP